MIKSVETSADKTIKIIFSEGFHCVIIPLKNNKVTLCVSSQVGCAMGCEFCLTAKMGFKRNLSVKEIIEQFAAATNHILSNKLFNKNTSMHSHEIINSIVFMGMGEPLNNYDNVIKSIDFLNENYSYPYKKITISTSGILPKMIKFIEDKNKAHLALSLHSPIQETRDLLMPYLKQYKIKDLVNVSNQYSKERKDKIMIEYIMISGITDNESDLKNLILLGFDKMTYFNLIPLNGNMILNGKIYYPSSKEKCEKFKSELIRNEYKCFIRYNMGEDINAACGMLSQKINTH